MSNPGSESLCVDVGPTNPSNVFEDALDEATLLTVLSFLPPKDLLNLRYVDRFFKTFVDANEDVIWTAALSRWYGVSRTRVRQGCCPPLADIQDPCPARALCTIYHRICHRYGSIGYRMIRVWNRIYAWCYDAAPEIFETLLPGVSLERIDQCDALVRQSTKGSIGLPLDLAALYSLCGGQSYGRLLTPADDPFDILLMRSQGMDQVEELTYEFDRVSGDVTLRGIFGGMKVYHDEFTLTLLPFDTMIYFTILSRMSRTRFLIAMNLYGVRYKHAYFDPNTEQLQLDPKPGMPQGIAGVGHDRRLYAPDKSLPPWYVSEKDQMKHVKAHNPEFEIWCAEMGYDVNSPTALCHWFESYAQELESDNFQYRYIQDLGKIVWKFPMKEPECGECITHGISVKASCVFCPHAVQSPSRTLIWAYNIQFRLLSAEEQRQAHRSLAEEIVEEVQLQGRYWKITSANGVDEIQGDGVIGQYPILTAGGPTYEYQSYTSVPTEEKYAHQNVSVEGFMEGYFTFSNRTINDPALKSIRAACPRMKLTFPDIIF
jgi:uncharacterized protein affecting Mg2+/Co2+ transport